jgi:hypothetical protein
MASTRLRLQPGERIILDMRPSAFWTYPRYVVTLGLWAIWRSRHQFVLTNQRVAHLQGIVSKHEKTVPVSRIQDVNLNRSILTGGSLTFSSAGGPLSIERIGPLSRSDARQFADALSAQQTQHPGDGLSAAPAPSNAGPASLAPMPPGTPAQWLPDPARSSTNMRYWDGQRWTDHVAPPPTDTIAGPTH